MRILFAISYIFQEMIHSNDFKIIHFPFECAYYIYILFYFSMYIKIKLYYETDSFVSSAIIILLIQSSY